MRRLLFIPTLFLFLNNGFSQKSDLDTFFSQTDLFMSMYVNNGLVDYENIKRNKIQLDSLVSSISLISIPKDIETSYKKAFLINSYNILVINLITENLPLNSPLDVVGFFNEKKHNVSEFGNITLNHLENNIIRKKYSDPRVHFALVCAGKSCPPIINKAYFPNTLEEQLNEQTKKSLNDDNFIRINDDKIEINEIFKWYNDDFESKENKNIIFFINNYRDSKIPTESKVSYYSYDWSLNQIGETNITTKKLNNEEEFNLQTYNPGSLLRRGQLDVLLFNSMYTQTKSNWMGTTFDGFRETFISTLVQVTIGASKSARFNLGFDIKLGASGKSSNDDFSTTTNALAFKNNDSTRVGISYLGPRIRIQPFKNEKNFTIQSGLFIAPDKFPEGRGINNGQQALYFLEWDRIQWWNQFFYTLDLKKSQLFFEADLWYRIGYKQNHATALDVPVTFIYSYFPTTKSTIYGIISHLTRNQYNPKNYNDGITSAANYTSVGLGMKYQLNSKLNLEILYTNFIRGVNSGLGNTFNLGIRYVR